MAFPVFFPFLVRFPLFGSFLSLLLFLFLCPFSSHLLALSAIFIRQRGAGASLLPPYSSVWGAGLCCPATTPGWLANGRGWQVAAPLTSHHQGAWGFESSAGHAAHRN
jgi:hypothetical protein